MSIEKRIGFQADSDGFWTMCSTSASVALIFRVLLARSERKNLIFVGFRPDDLKLYYRPVLQGFNNLQHNSRLHAVFASFLLVCASKTAGTPLESACPETVGRWTEFVSLSFGASPLFSNRGPRTLTAPRPGDQ